MDTKQAATNTLLKTVIRDGGCKGITGAGLRTQPLEQPLRVKRDRREDELDLAMNKISKPRETASKRTPKRSVPETPMATLLST